MTTWFGEINKTLKMAGSIILGWPTALAVIWVASEIFVLAALFQLFDGFRAVLVGNLRRVRDVTMPTILLFLPIG